MFFRGLIPRKSVTQLQTEEASDFVIASPAKIPYHEVYTDGAGAGKDQKHLPKYAQKVGAAAVAISMGAKGEIRDCDFILAAVPGEQTVPRAELHGFNFSASLAMQCQADASYVVNGTAALYEEWWETDLKESSLLKGKNADMRVVAK